MSICLSVTPSNMNISETSGSIATIFYLKHHWAWGNAALGFGSDWIRTLVFITTESSHKVTMEKTVSPLFMPPTLKKWGTYWFWLVSVCVCVRIGHRDIVFKLHVWIPHGKIADTYLWFFLNYLPLLKQGPLTNKGMKFCKCRISKSIIARNLKLVSADRG